MVHSPVTPSISFFPSLSPSRSVFKYLSVSLYVYLYIMMVKFATKNPHLLVAIVPPYIHPSTKKIHPVSPNPPTPPVSQWHAALPAIPATDPSTTSTRRVVGSNRSDRAGQSDAGGGPAAWEPLKPCWFSGIVMGK